MLINSNNILETHFYIYYYFSVIPNHTRDWKESLIQEKKYIVPESRIRVLIDQQRCMHEPCEAPIMPQSVECVTLPSGIKYTYACKVFHDINNFSTHKIYAACFVGCSA